MKLDTSIEYLKGVGPRRAEVFKKELKINTFYDFLNFFPYRYLDKTKLYKIKDVKNTNSYIQFIGKISSVYQTQGKGKRIIAKIKDETGSIDLIWFKGLNWIKEFIKKDHEYIVFGKPVNFFGKINFVHPEIEISIQNNRDISGKFSPIYPSTEKLTKSGITNKVIQKLMSNLVLILEDNIKETLSDDIKSKYKLYDLKKAYENVHFPKNNYDLQKSILRLKFDELFFLQLQLLFIKTKKNKKSSKFNFKDVGENVNKLYNECLNFDLTNAQKKVIKEIRQDLRSGYQMNRLLQGDVGCGKTIVALFVILIAIDNTCQGCLMAPTEILAQQHYKTIKNYLKNFNIKIELLTGSIKAKEKENIIRKLKNNEINLLIGTHAVIQKNVKFNNLGLVIIDEQHKFGVEQRSKLWGGENPPHILVMTATPIPRTLSMTIYGDLDVSIIDELPPGRKPIKTVHWLDTKRLKMFNHIKKEINQGRQIYIVYPLINESEKMDYKDLMDGYKSICREFPAPKYNISVVHGQMKPQDKNIEMKRFIKNESQIMVATNVIEVGVDIPNASTIIIESANRFGLSQLHQLRGRVGRGNSQAFCILMTDYKLSENGIKRMQIMTQTNDGFRIAEADLQLRGPGNMLGKEQSGIINFNIADIVKDQQLLILARESSKELLQEDPSLTKQKNINIKNNLNIIRKTKYKWSRIS